MPCSLHTFEQIKSKTYSFQPTTSIKEISWQCALFFPNTIPEPMVLLIADHNHINSCYFLLHSQHLSPGDPQRNCDPRLNWPAYETKIRQSFIQLGKSTGKSIFEIILQNKACFNGFGLNLATEALHHACIHPMWSSQLVFQQSTLRERLLLGLKAVTTEDLMSWNKYIPQHSYLDDPFHYNQRAIEFYQQHMNRVYDKHHCLVPKDICLTLHEEGLLVSHFSFSPFNDSLHFYLNVLELLHEKSYQFIKFGENTTPLVHHLMENLVFIPILLSKLFLILMILTITFTKGIIY